MPDGWQYGYDVRGRGTPLGFFVSVHSAGVEVLCFDTLLQVFILNELDGRCIYYCITRIRSFLPPPARRFARRGV